MWLIIFLLILISLFFLGCLLHNFVVAQGMRKAIAQYQRNPVTGIQQGAEPIYLEGRQDKPAILMIHGFIGCPSNFADLPQTLNTAGYTVYAPLLPGHGTDPRDFSQVSSADLIQSMRQAYSSLQKECSEVHLLGLSLGGALASILAAEKSPKSLILLAPYFQLAQHAYRFFPIKILHAIFKPWVPYIYKPKSIRQINNTRAIPYVFEYEFVSMKGVQATFDTAHHARKILDKLTCPTLVIHSKQDLATDYTASKKFAEKLSQRRLLTVDNSNHILPWDFDAEQIKKELLTYLSEQ